MRLNKLLFVLLSLSAFGIYSQSGSEIVYSGPPAFENSVLLETQDASGNIIGSGTGFIVLDGNLDEGFLYLVTAKHVLSQSDNESGILMNNPFLKISYSDNLSKSGYNSVIINLRSLGEKSLIAWSSDYDAIVVQLGLIKNGTAQFFQASSALNILKSFSKHLKGFSSEMLTPINDIKVGDEIFISGFPSSIGLERNSQYDYYKPLVRKGIISGLYPFKKTFILDCAVYPGNSGGPVIAYDELGNSRVLGIITQLIPIVDKNNNLDKDNSNYSVVLSTEVFSSLIKDLSEKTRKRGIKFID